MTLEVSEIIKKHFLTSRYEYIMQMSEVMMFFHSFSIHFVHRYDKNFIF